LTVLLARLPLPAPAFGSRAGFVRALRASRVRYGTAHRLTFPENSLEGFYASHVLEHLSKHDCEDLVARVRKWLKPGGVLRAVLPDLKKAAKAYVEGKADASEFVAGTYLTADGTRWWEILFGHSRHRWMYDAASFSQLLVRVGFRNLIECEMNQGQLEPLYNLDIPSRQAESFYIEAVK